MRKVYELDDHFATGETTVQPVLLWGANGQPLRERFSKTASEASEYIQSVKPLPGKSIVLVLAMGAYETYGLNRNGDGFNEHPYRVGFKPTCGHRQCESSEGWVKRGELLTDHYKSFEEFGKIYRHHQNKDPSKSSGDVIKAFWNPQMHRVELLLGLDNSKAADLVERIADGEYPAVSMGCKIKYDVCTICGHHAPTRADYCEHLKFSMRQVQPSGLQAGALNPTPKFFDISFVIKPADQTGYMMKKVAERIYDVRSSAELGERLDRVEEKRAAIRKLSEIEKMVTGQTAKADVPKGFSAARDPLLAVARGMPAIDDTTLQRISEHPIHSIMSTLAAGGVHLTTAELIKVLFNKAAPGLSAPDQALDAATFAQPLLLALIEEHPDLLDQMLGTGALDLGAEHIEPEIADKAKGYLEKRSTISEYLYRQIPAAYRDEQRPLTDVLTVTDPYTGAAYKTTRGAAIRADDRVAKQELLKMLGGGALLAAGHKIVASGLPKAMHPLSAGVALLGGLQLLKPDYGSRYMTDQGIAIPTTTELTKASSAGAALPLLSSAGLVTMLAHDYESRLRNGEYVGDPKAPIYSRAYDQISRLAHDNPAYGFLAGLATYGLGKAALGKFAEYLGPVTLPQVNAVDTPSVDFDKVAYRVGQFLWPQV